MGFSTSGSLLLIFAGFFIALGTLHSTTTDTAERIADATGAQAEQFDEVVGTQVNVTSARWNPDGNDDLVIRVTNTGETVLDVQAVDVLVDGEYVGIGDFERTEVDGHTSDVWRPGEQLVLEDTDTVVTQPTRVKVVTGPGVAAIAEVTA